MPTCCDQPMRLSGMGASPGHPCWICPKCECYQGPLGARTPHQWWRRDLDQPAWRWAQGQGYSTVGQPGGEALEFQYTVDRAAYDAHKAMRDEFQRMPLNLPSKHGMSVSESAALYCNEMKRVPVVDDPSKAVSLGDIRQTIDWYTSRIAASTTGLPYEVFYPAAAPYLKTMRDSAASDQDRLDAIRWLRLNGHYRNGGGIKDEVVRVWDDIAARRLAAAGALPDGGPTKAERIDEFNNYPKRPLMLDSAGPVVTVPLVGAGPWWNATYQCPACTGASGDADLSMVTFNFDNGTWRCQKCGVRSDLCATRVSEGLNPWVGTVSGPFLRIADPLPGDYVRWEHREYRNWAEGELVELTRPRKDLVARIKVGRSNFLAVGTVQGVGIEHGAKFCQAKRSSTDDQGSVEHREVRPCNHQVFEQRSAIDADAFHAASDRLRAEVAPRPDGFDQRQVDAAKAVLLASVPKKAKL